MGHFKKNYPKKPNQYRNSVDTNSNSVNIVKDFGDMDLLTVISSTNEN